MTRLGTIGVLAGVLIAIGLICSLFLPAADKPDALTGQEREEFYHLLATLRGAQAMAAAPNERVAIAQGSLAAFISERAGDHPCQLNEDAEWTCVEPPKPPEEAADGEETE